MLAEAGCCHWNIYKRYNQHEDSIFFLIVIKKKVGFSVVSSESSQLLQHHTIVYHNCFVPLRNWNMIFFYN